MKKLLLLLALVLCALHNGSALDNLDTVYLKRTDGNIYKLKYSPNDQYILALNSPDGAAVFTSNNGEYAATFPQVVAGEWSKDGKWLVTWVVYGAGNKLIRYETGTWRGMDTMYLPTGEDSHHAMSLAPDNRTLAISWSAHAKKSGSLTIFVVRSDECRNRVLPKVP